MSKCSISQRLAQVKPGTIHAGVDLAAESNVVVVISEKAERLDRFSFAHSRAGYDFFMQRIETLRQKHQASDVVVAMEPTNYFWKPLATYLEAKNMTYHLVNSYTVKKHREGDQLDRSKDDQRDAFEIADLSRTGKFTETRLQKGEYEDLRQLVTLYDQIQLSIRRERQILWGLVGQVFPELLLEFKELSGVLIEALLASRTPAAAIRQMKEDKFLSLVRTAYPGKRFSVKRLQSIYQQATTSIGVTEGVYAIQLAIQMHLTRIQTSQQQLKAVIATMSSILAALPETKYLLSIPAMGIVSVTMILAEVGDPKRYQNGSQWIKLAGIQPAPNTSGKKQRSPTPMSKQGRPRLRTILYYACLRLIQSDPYFIKIYHDLQRRKHNPLTKMQAVGVLMNKLLHIVWALITKQTFYKSPLAQST